MIWAGAGQGRAGQGREEQGRTGQDRTGQGQGQGQGQDRTGQDRAGQGRAGQDRAGQDRAEQDRAGQGRAGQGRAGQGRAASQPASQPFSPALTDGQLLQYQVQPHLGDLVPAAVMFRLRVQLQLGRGVDRTKNWGEKTATDVLTRVNGNGGE